MYIEDEDDLTEEEMHIIGQKVIGELIFCERLPNKRAFDNKLIDDGVIFYYHDDGKTKEELVEFADIVEKESTLFF